jgi:hypothetical protein
MRRAGLLLLAATLLAVPAAAKAPPPTRLMITAREYSLVLSRVAVDHGVALVQLVDRGQDPHDLVLRRLGGGRLRHVPETRPGQVTTVRWRLPPGRYALWCTLPEHRTLGMYARLTVRPARRAPRSR